MATFKSILKVTVHPDLSALSAAYQWAGGAADKSGVAGTCLPRTPLSNLTQTPYWTRPGQLSDTLAECSEPVTHHHQQQQHHHLRPQIGCPCVCVIGALMT